MTEPADVTEYLTEDNGSSGGGASRRIADYLRHAILNEEFAAGERIRQETLAQRLGASRLPVREASPVGLEDHPGGSGTRVALRRAPDVFTAGDHRSRSAPYSPCGGEVSAQAQR